jgi:hypothetical protein
VCIDDLRNPHSSARQVRDVIDRLQLSEFVTFLDGDFWRMKPESLPPDRRSIDLMWVDVPTSVRDVMELFDGQYWTCLRPDGILVIHDLMTTRGGRLIVDELKWQQRNRKDEFELVGLLQPHLMIQGDCVLVRKIGRQETEPVDDIIVPPGPDVLEDEAARFLKRREDARERS